jgi:O-antigen/teichoic acid export membrane protein
MAALSEPLLLLLFGQQWGGAAVMLSILSLVGMVQCVVFPVAWIFTSLGETKLLFKMSVIVSIMFVVAIGIGITRGVIGVAISYAVWTAAAGIINLSVGSRLIKASPVDILREISPFFLMAAIMGALVSFVDFVFAGSGPFGRIGIGVAVGVTCYGGLSFLFTRNTLMNVYRMVARNRKVPSLDE